MPNRSRFEQYLIDSKIHKRASKRLGWGPTSSRICYTNPLREYARAGLVPSHTDMPYTYNLLYIRIIIVQLLSQTINHYTQKSTACIYGPVRYKHHTAASSLGFTLSSASKVIFIMLFYLFAQEQKVGRGCCPSQGGYSWRSGRGFQNSSLLLVFFVWMDGW